MKKLLILATGGTIVCSDHGQGLRPHYTVDDLLKIIQQNIPNRTVVGKTVMHRDSSNMTPSNWLSIARHIVAEYIHYDGFVITHGTDTMAYTAAALTYLLQGLDKPVILTGSQYSMADSRTDALQNLNDSLLLAGEDIAGVFIVFDGKVINGTRGIKTKTHSYDAFESVNYPLVALVKHNLIEYNSSIRQVFARVAESEKTACTQPTLVSALEEEILVLKLFPGLHPKIFDYIRDNFRGVIIETYGTGGIATESLDLAGKINELIDAGVVVAITTQCLKEGVDLQVYEVGRKLPLEKIIYARDMNTDALVPKLMWAMAKGREFKEIKRLVETPVRGDLPAETDATHSLSPVSHQFAAALG